MVKTKLFKAIAGRANFDKALGIAEELFNSTEVMNDDQLIQSIIRMGKWEQIALLAEDYEYMYKFQKYKMRAEWEIKRRIRG